MTKALELAKFGRETPPTGVVVGDSDAQTLSSKTFSDGPVFSGLNANGVPFLNASKVLSSSATFVFDGTNLGVGVASPGVKIDVQGASAGSTVARFASNDTNTTTALAVFQRNGGAVSAAVKYNATNSPLTIDFGTTTNHALTFITADTERMRISSDGLAVTGALTVSTGVTAGATSGYTAGNIFVYDASGVARIGSNAGSTLRLFSNGVNAVDFNNAGTPTFNAGVAVTGTLSTTGHFLGSHYFNSTDVSGMYVSSIANNHYVNSALIGSFSSSGLAVTGTLSAGNTTLTGTSALTLNRSGAAAHITLQNNGTSTGILVAGTTNGLMFYDAAAGLPMGTWGYSAGLAVTGTITVNQNSTGVAGAFVNSDATNGYGVYIHGGGSSATRYALVVRDPAGNQDYFKISTVTGEVGHTIFRPGAYPSPEIARFTSTGLGIGTDNPTYKLHVTGNTYINGNFLQSALTSYQQQVISLSLNSAGWVKLFTMDSPGGCRVRYRAGSQNSEEIGEFTVKATYVAAGTQLTWSRQTYYSNINEIRVTGSNAGPFTVWALVRTTDYSPNLWWQVLEGNSYIALHNAVDTPGTAIVTLSYPGYNSTNFATDATFSGNVGIGIISPTTKLTVKGQTHTAPWLAVERNGSTTLQFKIVNAESTGYTASTGTISAPWTNVIDSSNSDLMLSSVFGGGTGGNIILDGKVGIGTTSPSVKFQTVQTTADWTGDFKNYTAGAYGLRVDLSGSSGNQAALQVYTAAGYGMIVRNDGAVGIGTFNPTKTLTVGGSTGYAGIEIKTTLGKIIELEQWYSNEGYIGLYLDTTRRIQFRANDVSYINGGNVGIGTDNPLAKLSLIDENGGQAMLQVRNYNTSATGAFTNSYTAEIRGASSGDQMHGMRIHLNESGYTTDRRTLDVSDYNGIFASFTNGKVGIGTIDPQHKLHVFSSSSTATVAKFAATNYGGSGTTYIEIGTQYGDGSSRIGNINPVNNQSILVFETMTSASGVHAERARIAANGFTHFLSGGSYYNAAGNWHSFESATADDTLLVINSHGSSPYGVNVFFNAAVPNNSSNYFYNGVDGSATTRFTARTNGGIANYSGNNVNLSDRREKTNFALAKPYLDIICAIPVQTFNYIDQNLEQDGGLTLGAVAQDVQAVAPELVTESNWGTKEEPKMRLSIYQTDLQYALMKCIQEQQVIIKSLKARLDAANL